MKVEFLPYINIKETIKESFFLEIPDGAITRLIIDDLDTLRSAIVRHRPETILNIFELSAIEEYLTKQGYTVTKNNNETQ